MNRPTWVTRHLHESTVEPIPTAPTKMQTTIVAPRPPPPPTTATAMADIDTVKDLLALSPDGAAAAGKFKRSTLVKALNAAAESGSHFDEVSPSI